MTGVVLNVQVRCEGSMRSLLRGVLRDGVLQGVVASMEVVPTRHVVLRRVLVRWSIPVYQAVVISPV